MPNQYSKPNTPLGQTKGSTGDVRKASSNCGTVNKQLGEFFKAKSQYNYEPGNSPRNGGKDAC